MDGCDGNAREDWVRIDASALTIEGVTFHAPVLVAHCPGEPRMLMLVEGTGDPPYFADGTPGLTFEPR